MIGGVFPSNIPPILHDCGTQYLMVMRKSMLLTGHIHLIHFAISRYFIMLVEGVPFLSLDDAFEDLQSFGDNW